MNYAKVKVLRKHTYPIKPMKVKQLGWKCWLDE